VHNGHADVVRYLCASGVCSPHRLESAALEHAARRGDIDMFMALRDHGLDETLLAGSRVVGCAVAQHRVDLVAWLCDAYPRLCESALARAHASKCPHDCGSPPLVFSDVDLDWMRVMRQYADHERRST